MLEGGCRRCPPGGTPMIDRIRRRLRWFGWAQHLAWSALLFPDNVEQVASDHVVMMRNRIRIKLRAVEGRPAVEGPPPCPLPPQNVLIGEHQEFRGPHAKACRCENCVGCNMCGRKGGLRYGDIDYPLCRECVEGRS